MFLMLAHSSQEQITEESENRQMYDCNPCISNCSHTFVSFQTVRLFVSVTEGASFTLISFFF